MTRAPTATSVGYFGKIPSRGDFVKGSDNPALIKVLDDWLAQAMDLMSADARWKLNYDAVAPLHFAFIGPRRRHAIAGHIVASSDQSNRRFPFLMMSSMEIVEPAAFVPNAPLLLGRLAGDICIFANSAKQGGGTTWGTQCRLNTSIRTWSIQTRASRARPPSSAVKYPMSATCLDC